MLILAIGSTIRHWSDTRSLIGTVWVLLPLGYYRWCFVVESTNKPNLSQCLTCILDTVKHFCSKWCQCRSFRWPVHWMFLKLLRGNRKDLPMNCKMLLTAKPQYIGAASSLSISTNDRYRFNSRWQWCASPNIFEEHWSLTDYWLWLFQRNLCCGSVAGALRKRMILRQQYLYGFGCLRILSLWKVQSKERSVYYIEGAQNTSLSPPTPIRKE